MVQLGPHVVRLSGGTHHPRCRADGFVVGCLHAGKQWEITYEESFAWAPVDAFCPLAMGAIVAGVAIADEDLPTITITASRMGRSAVTTETVGRSGSTLTRPFVDHERAHSEASR
jgi:hypothetical protein